MKKHIMLFSSVLVFGAAALSLAGTEVRAESNSITPVEITANAEEKADFYVNSIGYKITNATAKEVAITTHYINGLAETLVIPEKVTSSGVEYAVTAIEEQGLVLFTNETDSVKSVTLPKSLKAIGRAAFYNRKNLESVSFNEGLTSIGINAFSGTGIKALSLPSTLTTIGKQAFMNNSALVSVTIPQKVKSIEDFMFKDCTSLSQVTLASGLESIGGSAFNNASSLKTLVIPNSVKTIGIHAFNGAAALTTITLPNGLTVIESSLFTNCLSLKELQIPNTVSKILSGAFTGSGLSKITLPTGLTDKTDFGGESIYGDFVEQITFTSPIANGMYGNVFKAPVKDGQTFEGWADPEGNLYQPETLSEPAKKGNVTLTAKWKQGSVTPTPSSGTSDATIKLLEKQPVGAVSFGSVSTDAAIIFNDITLNGAAQTTKENTGKTTAKVVVNDSRTDKTNGWKVEVQYGDTNFTSKNMKLELKPTSTTTTGLKALTVTGAQQELFNNGAAKNANYSVLLNPELTIPKDFSAKNEQKTTIKWTLTSEV